MIETYKKISIIDSALDQLINLKLLLEADMVNVENSLSMDRITLTKIQAQIDEINLKIKALEAHRLLTQSA